MNGSTRVTLNGIEFLDSRAIPSEFPLFVFGDNVTNKGTFKLDEAGAQAILAAYKQHGIELAIDYEHQTFSSEENGQPAPAAGWFVPELRSDGIWATKVRWTARAADMLRNAEYRYFSPTFVTDAEKRITRLLPAALTNWPASQKQQALVAAKDKPGAAAHLETIMPNGLATVIGLKDDATEDQISERVVALAGIERRLLDATGAGNLADAMTVVLAYKDAAADRDKYKQMCREWQERHDREGAEEKKRQIDAIIHGAILDGRVSLKDDERIARWRKHGEDYGADQLAKLVAERDPRPVRQFQAPPPANTIAEQFRAIEEYKKAHPNATTADAYVALAAERPALFTSQEGR